jgi:hypothetical protein
MKIERLLLALVALALMLATCESAPQPTTEPTPQPTSEPRLLMMLSNNSGGTIRDDGELNAYPTGVRILGNAPRETTGCDCSQNAPGELSRKNKRRTRLKQCHSAQMLPTFGARKPTSQWIGKT